MTAEAICATDTPTSASHFAQVLADWWTQPDSARVALWCSAEYQEQVTALWEEVVESSADPLRAMLSTLAGEPENSLASEYERLFVGPAAVPCPPYEAVWRTDRPKHEQGTVMGSSTLAVKQLYGELGIRLRPGQAELPDHIAIEFEALAVALAVAERHNAEKLLRALRMWVPELCCSVMNESSVQFYRDVAGITREAMLSKSFESLVGNPQQVSVVKQSLQQ